MGFIHEKIDGFGLETRRESAVLGFGEIKEVFYSKDAFVGHGGPFHHLEMRYADWLRLRAWLNDPRVVKWLEEGAD